MNLSELQEEREALLRMGEGNRYIQDEKSTKLKMIQAECQKRKPIDGIMYHVITHVGNIH